MKQGNKMHICEANEILNKYPHHNVNALYSIYRDPNVDKSHWSQTLWDIIMAVDTTITFQNR